MVSVKNGLDMEMIKNYWNKERKKLGYNKKLKIDGELCGWVIYLLALKTKNGTDVRIECFKLITNFKIIFFLT